MPLHSSEPVLCSGLHSEGSSAVPIPFYRLNFFKFDYKAAAAGAASSALTCHVSVRVVVGG